MNIQQLRLLVTGSTGFIGSRLAMQLHRLGIDAAFTGRDGNDAEDARLRELDSSGIQVRLGDLRDPAFVDRILIGRNAVLHLAAAQHESHMDAEYFRSINLGATRLLLEKSRAAGVRRFVYGGTMGVYGAATNGPIREDTPVRPLNIYTQTKLAAEQAVHEHGQHFETAIVRIGETYGPGDLRLLKLFRAIDKGRFVMIGGGENLRQPIYVEDLIRGLLAALMSPAAVGQTMLLVGNETMTTREMAGLIAAALQRPTPKLRVPMWPVLGLASVVNGALRPLRVRSPLHPRSLDFFRKSFVFSAPRAKTLLGFEPTTRFIEGARATLAWYRAQGYMPARTTASTSHTARV